MSDLATSFFIVLFLINGLLTLLSIATIYLRLTHICRMPFINYFMQTLFVCLVCALVGSIWGIFTSLAGGIIGFYVYHIFMIYIPTQPRMQNRTVCMIATFAVAVIGLIYSHKSKADVYRQYNSDGSFHYRSTLEQPLFYPRARQLTGGYDGTQYNRNYEYEREAPAREMLEEINESLEMDGDDN